VPDVSLQTEMHYASVEPSSSSCEAVMSPSCCNSGLKKQPTFKCTVPASEPDHSDSYFAVCVILKPNQLGRLRSIRCKRRASTITRSRDDSYDTEWTEKREFRFARQSDSNNPYRKVRPRY